MQNPIELVLLTGFLGSGKTTLLNAILADHRDRGIGILMNEFGKIGIDGALVRRADAEDGMIVYEVADGSIFCTCKSASFVAGLRMFARIPEGRRPERLIVEASGMSDPSGLTRLLRDNRLAGDYVVTSVACLVDAVRFVKVVHTLPAVRRQVEAADLVILNKVDLAGEAEIERVESMIAGINDQATVARSSFGRIDEDTLWEGASRDLAGELVSCSVPEDRPAALDLIADDIARARLDRFLREALELTYRVKGWLRVDGGWYFVSDNSGRVEFVEQSPPAGQPAGLSVICAPENSGRVADLWRAATGAT